MNVLPGLLKKVCIKDFLKKKRLSVYVHVQVCWITDNVAVGLI